MAKTSRLAARQAAAMERIEAKVDDLEEKIEALASVFGEVLSLLDKIAPNAKASVRSRKPKAVKSEKP